MRTHTHGADSPCNLNEEVKDVFGGGVACINSVCTGHTLERIIRSRICIVNVGSLSFLYRPKRFSKETSGGRVGGRSKIIE